LTYPWGNKFDQSKIPARNTERDMRPADDVDAHPSGASVYGVEDLVGNVYQWTNEFIDDHTRAALVRGGNYYHPQGSGWYFRESYELYKHGKYLLMAPSIDRSKGIGFRCVADLEK